MRKYKTANYLQFRRQLRLNQTPAETKLWTYLRRSYFHGYKFRRQHSLGPYIYDFYCYKLRLIIEVDGSQHFFSKEKDNLKADYARDSGFQVLRYWNSEVLENIDGVLTDIYKHIQSPPFSSP